MSAKKYSNRLFLRKVTAETIHGKRGMAATPNGDTPTDEEMDAIYSYLLEHRDGPDVSTSLTHGVTVSSVWQDQIAAERGIPLHRVMRAIALLHKADRIRIEQQEVGKPFRYTLLSKRGAQEPVRIAI